MGSDPKEWWPDTDACIEDAIEAYWLMRAMQWAPISWSSEADCKMNIKLKNVRLSFPALFEARAFGGDEDAAKSFSAAFILNKKKHAELIEQIEEGIQAVAAEKWGKKIPKLKGTCLGDGADKEDVDGYGEEVMFISARSKNRVPVVDTDPSIPLAKEDNKPYAGCYVNATIRLWAQDNKFGKRVNAALRAVQFYKDGEPFGEAPADAEKEFEDESDGGDDEPKSSGKKKKSLL